MTDQHGWNHLTTVGFVDGSTGTFTDLDRRSRRTSSSQSRARPTRGPLLAASDPFGDFDGDGLVNQEEASEGLNLGERGLRQ